MQEMLNQSSWINHLLKNIEENQSKDTIRLVELCGKCCAQDSGHLEGAVGLHDLMSECKTRSEYVEFMRKTFPFDVEEADDGIIIHYKKKACTCRMSPEVKNPILCNCTLGHEKAMWGIVFGREIDAEIIESFQLGGKDCVVKLIV